MTGMFGMDGANAVGLSLAPHAPLWLMIGLAILALIVFGVGLARRMPGAWLRLAASICLLVALLNPRVLSELRDPLDDVAVLLIDKSASDEIDGRMERLEAARAQIETAIGALGPDDPIELRTVEIERTDPRAPEGTMLFTALDGALAEIDPERLAGVIALTDGRAHDDPLAPETIPAPLHVLNTGRSDEFDRRLALENAPASASSARICRSASASKITAPSPPSPRPWRRASMVRSCAAFRSRRASRRICRSPSLMAARMWSNCRSRRLRAN